ncbi:hypothetical protein Tco_0825612 [Tanacetum coccineum]
MELNLEARLMGETLVINRSVDPLNGDYIELNDLNEPLVLRRNQGDDLMPTIKEGEVIEEFRTRDEELDTRINDYPSYCDHDKKIHIDCAHNLKFSCMIGFEFTHVNFFPLLYVNVMFKKFHNSIMKDKMVYKGDNVVGALMNVPILVRTFYIVTDFAVLEDMDAYRDEGMVDVIFGEPFLRELGIKGRRFEGKITIYNEFGTMSEDITTCLGRCMLKFWDDWEVDRYRKERQLSCLCGLRFLKLEFLPLFHSSSPNRWLNLNGDVIEHSCLFYRTLAMYVCFSCLVDCGGDVYPCQHFMIVIIEYLVNISKRRAFWSLNEDILKINDSDNQYTISIKEDTAYPSCTHQRPQRNFDQYAVSREYQYAVLEK